MQTIRSVRKIRLNSRIFKYLWEMSLFEQTNRKLPRKCSYARGTNGEKYCIMHPKKGKKKKSDEKKCQRETLILGEILKFL